MNEAMQIWTWKRLNWAERAVASVWRDWITRTIQSKRLIWECKETIYHDDDAETYVPLGSFGISGPQFSELIRGQGLLGLNAVDQGGVRGVGGVASLVSGAGGFGLRRLGYGSGILEERGRILEMMRRREIDLEVEVVADPEMHLRLRSTVVRKRHRFGFWGNEWVTFRWWWVSLCVLFSHRTASYRLVNVN